MLLWVWYGGLAIMSNVADLTAHSNEQILPEHKSARFREHIKLSIAMYMEFFFTLSYARNCIVEAPRRFFIGLWVDVGFLAHRTIFLGMADKN